MTLRYLYEILVMRKPIIVVIVVVFIGFVWNAWFLFYSINYQRNIKCILLWVDLFYIIIIIIIVN